MISKSAFTHAWNHYHLLDWIVLATLYIIASIVTGAVKPFCRPFSWNDATIAYPQHPDTFPNYALVIMMLVTPAFYAVFVLYLVKPIQGLVGEPMEWYALGGGAYAATSAEDSNSKRMRIRDMQTGNGPLYPWLRAHFWAVGLDFCITSCMKVYAGRLRPDYLSRLKTAGYTSGMPSLPSPQEDPAYFCRLMDDHPALQEGRLSFPSGHSSTSFSVFTLVAFFCVAHLRPFARQASFTRLVLCLCPLIVSTMCAVSRTRDNKHHFSDILGGTLIGIFCASVSFYGSFRQVGGPATIYFGRSADDVEYHQMQEPQAGDAAVSGTEFGAVQQREDAELRKGTSSTMRGASDTAVLVGGGQRGSAVLTERKLNEDPAAVSWI